ncbi:MAG: TonB-dependent receptor [Gammaproteobacteria bacterium]
MKKIYLFLLIFANPFVFSQEDSEITEELLVVGTKASIISAIEKQRDSNQILSVIDSDALGEFPDTTAAEALRRISGISVENDQGEGRYVTVRGLSGDLNNISVNGATIPAPEGGRKVMLDGLPTELLDSIEVYKSLTPDQDLDSIGGRVEFNTKSALDLDGTYFKLKANTQYNDQTYNNDNPKISLTYGDMISENAGHIIGLTYSKKQVITYNNETGFPAWAATGGNYAIDDDFESRYYDLTRERLGITYDIDYRINDESSMYANILWNEYVDDELRYKDEYGKLKNSNVTATGSTITEIRRDAEVRVREEVRTIRTFILGGNTIVNGWDAEFAFSNSFAEEDDTDNVDAKFRSSTFKAAACGGPCGSFDYSNPQKPRMTLVPAITTGAGNIYDPASMGVDEIEEEDSVIDDTISSFQADFTKEGFTVSDIPTTLKFGFKYSTREKEKTVSGFASDPGTSQSNYNPITTPVKWPFPNVFGPMADPATIFALQGTFGSLTNNYAKPNYNKDFVSEEDITALYLMGTMEIENAVVIAGLRAEDTSFDTLGYNKEDGSIIRASKNYTFVSPSVNVKYFVNDDTIVRGAIWRSLSRPGFGETAPVADFKSDGTAADGSTIYKGEMGNPDLEPYESTNLDLTFERYYENGAVSIGYFSKDVKNVIYPQVTAGVVGGINFSELKTYINSEKSTVDGIEFNFFREFVNLPEPFDGLFISLNLTEVDAESDVPSAAGVFTVPFRKLADSTRNLSIGYDKGKVDMRLSLAERSDYLDYLADDDIETTVDNLNYDNIRFTDDHSQIDFTAKYYLNDNLTLKLDLININDEPEFYYWGNTSRLSQYDEYGRSATIGFTYKY